MGFFQDFTLVHKLLYSTPVQHIVKSSKSNDVAITNMFKFLVSKRDLIDYIGLNVNADISNTKGISVIVLQFILKQNPYPIKFTLQYDLKTKQYSVLR
jgi:hypothetical protein